MRPVSRRAVLTAGIGAAILRALPAAAQSPPRPLLLDDVSRLNAVPIARHWRPPRATGPAWLDALRAELKTAAAEGRAVCVGAARHSMGGQALARDGVAMTFDVKAASSDRCTVSTGSSGSPPAPATSTSASSCRGCWTCRS
jgi:hypothetical protein